MTLITVSSDSFPMYIITETSDIVDNKVVGASYKGKTLFDSEAQTWYVISDDLTLSDFILPTSGGGGGGSVVTNAGTFAVQDNGTAITTISSSVVAQGTSAPTKIEIIGGKTNDGTPQYREIPEGAGGRSVIVEGFAGGTPQPISGTVDTELPVASALNGTIVKSVSAPVVGAALLVSDNTNLIQPLGDAANGLDVDVTRLPALVAGTALIGKTATTGNNSTTGDTEINAITVGADGTSNTSNRLAVVDHGKSFNGTTWDRIRSGIITVGSTFTGFINHLPWGIFNTSPTTRTTGQGGPLETSSDGSLRVIPSMNGNDVNIETSGSDATSNTQNNLTVTSRGKVYNGSTWDRIREATADALAVTGLQGIANMVWNGATWDRQAGNTNGNFTQGNVANSATDSGNPLKVGGKYNSTLPTYTDGQRGDLQIGTRGAIDVTLFSANTVNPITALNPVDSATFANHLGIGGFIEQWNGATWDRQRNNLEVTVLASAARSADTNTSDQINYNAKGVIVTIDLTVLGSTSITFTITYKDSLSGKYQTLLASAALVGAGTTSLTIYPGITATANSSLSFPLPRLYRVQSVRGGTPGTDTYSISANYIV